MLLFDLFLSFNDHFTYMIYICWDILDIAEPKQIVKRFLNKWSRWKNRLLNASIRFVPFLLIEIEVQSQRVFNI